MKGTPYTEERPDLYPHPIILTLDKELITRKKTLNLSRVHRSRLPAFFLYDYLISYGIILSMKFDYTRDTNVSGLLYRIDSPNRRLHSETLNRAPQKCFPDDFQILPSSDTIITVTSSWYFLRSPCGMSSNSFNSIPAYTHNIEAYE